MEAGFAYELNYSLSPKRMVGLYLNYAEFGPKLYGIRCYRSDRQHWARMGSFDESEWGAFEPQESVGELSQLVSAQVKQPPVLCPSDDARFKPLIASSSNQPITAPWTL
ncbi:hypothetical protein J7E82_14435 [Arthrobacter sp. ISL-30]|nr:hypothetical protein [Arthrobacter sp. ISL-30]